LGKMSAISLMPDQVFGIITAAGSLYAATQVASYWRVDDTQSYLKTLTGNAWLAISWALIGFSITYGPSQASRVIGNAQLATIDEFRAAAYTANFTGLSISFVYSLSLVLLANAILSSVSARMSWGNYVVFGTIWTLGSYVPLTHWIYANFSETRNGGWLGATAIAANNLVQNGKPFLSYGLQDYAAVHPIHINAGVSALVLTYWMRHHDSVEHAHNVWDVLPALSFGWLFYVVGATPNYTESLGGMFSYGNAAAALVNTVLAGAGGAFTWATLEWVVADAHLEVAGGWRKLFTGTPSATGAVTGTLSGLVAISAAGGFVAPTWAIFFGFFTALVVFFGPTLVSRYLPNFSWAAKQNYSAFMVHGVAGAVGSALTGLFANSTYQSQGYVEGATQTKNSFNGSFYYNAAQLGKQCAGITITIAMATVVTTVAYWFTFYVGRLAFYPAQTGLSEAETGDEKL